MKKETTNDGLDEITSVRFEITLDDAKTLSSLIWDHQGLYALGKIIDDAISHRDCGNSLEEKVEIAKALMVVRAEVYRKLGNTAFSSVIEEAQAILEKEVPTN